MTDVDPLDLLATIREGLLVLEPDLTVRFANRSFCKIFGVAPEDTIGRKLYELGDRVWDIPELRHMLEAIIPEHATIEAFELDRVFPSIGRRVMLLNARKVYRPVNNVKQILLTIEDVTERWRLERSGTSFERLLNATRAHIAEHLLRDTDRSLTEIAFDLGFSDPSAFTRAARRWFNMPPRVYRQMQRRGEIPPP
jgi:PAS domain S-box-containing protein